MARPQQQQVQAREVVQTLEDQHKYAMPDDRRLYVKADPIWIQTTPAESTLTQFAQSLAQVKPEIMDWAVDRQAKIYGEEINQGQQAAREGKVPSNPTEHMQWGYDATQSVNDAASWTTAVQQDYEQNFDKENGDIEKFLQDHYAKSPAAGKSDIYQTNFYKQADRVAQGLRAAAAKDKLTILDDKTNTSISDLVYGDIKHTSEQNIPWTLAEYEARRADVRKLFPGKTNKELDALVYEAAHRFATESLKPEILDVFKETHSDGTPGLASKYWEKIKTDQQQIVTLANQKTLQAEAHADKALKKEADKFQLDAVLEIAQLATEPDENVKQSKLLELLGKTKEISSRLPIDESFVKDLASRLTKNGNKEETQAQQRNERHLAVTGFSVRQLAGMADREEISNAGFHRLLAAHNHKLDRAAAAAAKGEKPVWEKPEFKHAVKEIRSWAGYKPMDFSNDATEKKANADAAQQRFGELVDSYMEDEKMSLTAATDKAKHDVIETLKSAGKASKEMQDAYRAMHKDDQIKANPKAYYKENLKDFDADFKAGKLPQSLSAEDKKFLVAEYIKSLPKKSTKLKDSKVN